MQSYCRNPTKMRQKKIRMTFNVGIFLLCSSEAAYAYLDPGSASMFIQLLFGGIAAGFAMVGLYWKLLFFKIRSFFSRKASSKKEFDATSGSKEPK